ncbi:TMEM165/GDT1 family protein [Algiphilus sp.]|uniref:TMEM165/GDT1 family protein n=2 Tax=Algiphilus sp. TaxID=1872431 RepID=UPI0025BABEA8|nr:TMEM165/GDT1 family protein [Algiphilus sp.]MCK5769020.1 TMEM165/GDT1 family protein [Algiphilus sp.]
MDAFAVSTALVAIAEIGDKTQLLALALAARYRRAPAICAGILVATVANHALAGAAGLFIAHELPEGVLQWVVGLSFIAMAAWMLVPDRLDDDEMPRASQRGAFAATLILFFIAEMGDKTQIATAGLAARFDTAAVAVVAGSTLGMLIANVPVVWLGDRYAPRIPFAVVRAASAALFALLGVATLLW